MSILNRRAAWLVLPVLALAACGSGAAADEEPTTTTAPPSTTEAPTTITEVPTTTPAPTTTEAPMERLSEPAYDMVSDCLMQLHMLPLFGLAQARDGEADITCEIAHGALDGEDWTTDGTFATRVSTRLYECEIAWSDYGGYGDLSDMAKRTAYTDCVETLSSMVGYEYMPCVEFEHERFQMPGQTPNWLADKCREVWGA